MYYKNSPFLVLSIIVFFVFMGKQGAPSAPALTYGSYAITGTTNNSFFDANDYNDLTVKLNNTGTVALTAKNATLASSTPGVIIAKDTVNPVVAAIDLLDPNPTTATTVQFLVIFSEPVDGVTSLSAVVQGPAGGSVTDMVTSSPTEYIFTVGNYATSGTIALEVPASATILDNVGNPLTTSFTSGQYTILAPAQVLSLTRDSANPTSGPLVQYRIMFSDDIVNLAATDFLLTNTLTATGTITTITPVNPREYLVTVDNISGDGELQITLVGSPTVTDTNGSQIANTPFEGEVYTVDSTAPEVTRTLQLDPSPTSATTVRYTIEFSEPVTGVDAADFLVIGTLTGDIISITETSSTLYEIVVSNYSGEGTIGLHYASGLTIYDLVGNPLGSQLAFDAYDVDTVNPVVAAIDLLDQNPTTATTVQFLVVFSEPVDGVTSLSAVVQGTAGGSVTDVVTSSPTEYIFTVGNYATSGTVALEVPASATILDKVGNPLTTPFTSAPYNILGATEVVSLTRDSANPTSGPLVQYRVVFSDDIVNLAATDFLLTNTLTATGTITTIDPVSPREYLITVDNISGDGELQITFVGSSTVTDTNGSPIANAPFEGEVYTVDSIAPEVTQTLQLDPSPTSATTVRYTIEFSEPVTGVDAADFVVTGTLTGDIVSMTETSSSLYEIAISNYTGYGTIGLDYQTSLTIFDYAGNSLANRISFQLYDVATNAPTVLSITQGNQNPTSRTEVIYFVEFDQPVNGFTSDTITLTGTLTGTLSDPVTTDGITYEVRISDVIGSGTIGMDIPVPSSITGTGGVALEDPASGELYDVDNVNPIVAAIDLLDPNPTTATTVQFLVIFSEPVDGVTSLSAVVQGTAGGSVTDMVTSSPSEYIFTVGNYATSGTVALEVPASVTIIDSYGNPLITPFTSDPYTILGPSEVVSLTRNSANPTSGPLVQYRIVFSDDIVNLSATDFLLTNTLTATGTITTITPVNPREYLVTVDNISGDGELQITFVGSPTVTDTNGSQIANTPFEGEVYTVDSTAPVVTETLRLDPSPTSATTVRYTIKFNEPVVDVDMADFLVTGTLTGDIVSITETSSTLYEIAISNYTGYGTIGLDYHTSLTIFDYAANPLANRIPFQLYDVATSAPTVLSITQGNENPTSRTEVIYFVEFDQPVNGFTSDTITLTGTLTGILSDPVTTDGLTYEVRISDVIGSGTIGMEILVPSTITNTNGDPLQDPAYGELYFVDNVSPVVTRIDLLDPNPTPPIPLHFLVVFSEDVTTPTLSDFSLITTGPTGLITDIITSSSSEYIVEVTGVTGEGELALRVETSSTITDLMGNRLTNTPVDSLPYIICATSANVFDPQPADGANVASGLSQLSWSTSNTTTQNYQVYLNGSLYGVTTDTQIALNPPLGGGCYTWQVVLETPCSDLPGPTWEFSIMETPVNLTPGDGDILCEFPASYTWQAVDGATLYRLYVDGILRGTSTTPNFPGFPLANGTHTWYVEASSSCVSLVSATTSFTVQGAGEDTPTFWRTDGQVHAIEVTTDTVYIGGNFQTVWNDSISSYALRRNIAAFDRSTGEPTDFKPVVNNTVHALKWNGTHLIAGGTFSQVNGITRNRLAAFETSGTLLNWNPNSNAVVRTLAISQSGNILVGGDFTTIGGSSRGRLASFDSLTSNTPNLWNPNANNQVHTILPVPGNQIAVGGIFTQIDGLPIRALSMVNNDTTGSVDVNFNLNVDLYVYTLAHHDNSASPGTHPLIVGGQFNTIDGQVRHNLAAVSLATRKLDTDFTFNTDSSVLTARWSRTGSVLYIGGTFTHVNQNPRSRMAAISFPSSSPALSNCAYNANNIVRAIYADTFGVITGGDFTVFNNKAATGLYYPLATVSTETHAVDWQYYAD